MIVSIAVVAHNEAATLPRLLENVVGQDYPHQKIELLLIDSASQDQTRALMERFAAGNHDFSRVIVLDNPDKTLPYGCNVALRNYTGDAIVRIDAHAEIPADFIRKNVAVLESGEYISGGPRPNIVDEATPWKQTLLMAEQSMFGSSIASYRRSREKSYVNSVFHGMYRREVYEKTGAYDVRLARTEDNDMSWRIRQAGFRFCYCPDIISFQHTRSSLKSMLRQKYANGYWIGKTLGINPRCFSIYHFVPFLFVGAILVTTVLAILSIPYFSWLMWGAYLLLLIGISCKEIVTRPFHPVNLCLPLLFFLLHISYGIGTMVGLIELPFWLRDLRKNGRR